MSSHFRRDRLPDPAAYFAQEGQLIAAGEIPSIRVGHSLRVVPDQLQASISAKNEK